MKTHSILIGLAASFVAFTASAIYHPGLKFGSVSGQNNWTDQPATTTVERGPSMALTTKGWGSSITYVYSGQMYFDGSTYNFAEGVDDGGALKIDGVTIFTDTSWSAVGKGSVTPTAGWHDIEIRLTNGSGGAGPNSRQGWSDIGFGYNKGGATDGQRANYTYPEDPGDGSFFRYDDGVSIAGVIEVDGAPEQVSLDGITPAYGSTDGHQAGEAVSFSVPAGTNEFANGRRAFCLGWKIYKYDATSGTLSPTPWREGTGNAITDYIHPEIGTKVVWQWQIENKVSVAGVGATTDKTELWVAPGTAVSVTATTKSGMNWLGWNGTGVTSANRRNASISVTVNGPVALTALASPSDFVSGTTYYVADYGDDANDGLSWASPKKDIPSTVAACGANDGVILSDGAFALTGTVNLVTAVKVRGVVRDLSVVTGAKLNAHGFNVGHSDAELSDLTISNVTTDNNTAGLGKYLKGIGLYMTSGFVHDCRISNCGVEKDSYGITGKGAHMTGGHLSRVIIEDCNRLGNGDDFGGGLYIAGGLADHILVRNCAAKSNGGGIYVKDGTSATVYPVVAYATVVGCTSGGKGGGVYVGTSNHGRLYNCVFYGNTADNDTGTGKPNWYDSKATDYADRILNCATSVAFGTNPVTSGIVFKNAEQGDYRPGTGSLCIDAGLDITEILPAASTNDLNGIKRPQGTAPDIGCYEYFVDSVEVGGRAEPSEVMQGNTVTFTATVVGADPADLTYAWTLTGENGASFTSTESTFTKTVDTPDWYSVTLEVKKDGTTLGTFEKSAFLHIGALTNYVSTTGSATRPYATTASAATSVQAAIDEALPGAVILVAPGTYERDGELRVAKDVKLLGTGPTWDGVVLKQSGTSGEKRVLCLSAVNAVVSNVTMTGGTTTKNWSNGLGVYIDSAGGTITHCHITGNISAAANTSGAGVFMTSEYGVLTHCRIDQNTTKSLSAFGGGVNASAGIIDNCLICDNTGVQGGGLALLGPATVRHCTIVRNIGLEAGGGVSVRANGATVIDTIFDLNVLKDGVEGNPEWHTAGASTATFTQCMWPEALKEAAVGTQFDSLFGTPVYTDAENGDFRPLPKSPTVGKGIKYDGMSAVDFDGKPRLFGRRPDLGCYECQQPHTGLILLFR